MSTLASTPYLCPFCGEEELRPVPADRWHCLACLRVFSVICHAVSAPAPAPATTSWSEHP